MALMRRYLDPSSRLAEILFGLIMTLTFTLGAGLVIEEGPDATKELLTGVIGCNIAWGIIDGLLFVMGAMYDRGAPFRAVRLFRTKGRDTTGEAIDASIEETYGEALSAETRRNIRTEILDHLATLQPGRVHPTRDDVMGAVESFLLVAATAVPAVLPFLVIDDTMLALRVSNFLLIALLYFVGCQWASFINANRQRVGLSMALGGLAIVQLTILLGG
jgi:VIT1/CCC1 family predicted Fe2+/Mn2+ transporter